MGLEKKAPSSKNHPFFENFLRPPTITTHELRFSWRLRSTGAVIDSYRPSLKIVGVQLVQFIFCCSYMILCLDLECTEPMILPFFWRNPCRFHLRVHDLYRINLGSTSRRIFYGKSRGIREARIPQAFRRLRVDPGMKTRNCYDIIDGLHSLKLT